MATIEVNSSMNALCIDNPDFGLAEIGADSIGANLLSINNDCILEILNKLECIDLGSVAGLSGLQEAIQMVFASKWKGNVTFDHGTKSRASDFLQNIGSQIRSIRLVQSDDVHENGSEIVRSISQFCSEGTLSNLEIIGWSCGLVDEISPSLLSGLQTLFLQDCVIPSGMLNSCKELTELTLMRVEEIRSGGEQPHLALNKLKTLKIEMHSKIRCQHPHCNMNATHLEHLGYEEHREVRTPRLHGVEFINGAESLEHLEIDVLPQHLLAPIIATIPTFKNIKTLNLYCEYFEIHPGTLDVVGQLEHLTEFVWGYPKRFSVNNLLYVIRNANNLEQLIVSFSNRRPTAGEPATHQISPIDAESYEQMLNIVSKRASGKPLNVIIVGHRYETHLKQFEVAVAMHELLKITCLMSNTLAPILKINMDGAHGRIKMSNEQIKVLRDGGLLL